MQSNKMIVNAELSVCVVRNVKITTVSMNCVAIHRLGIPIYSLLFILIMLFQYSCITQVQLVADVKVFSIVNFDRNTPNLGDVYV